MRLVHACAHTHTCTDAHINTLGRTWTLPTPSQGVARLLKHKWCLPGSCHDGMDWDTERRVLPMMRLVGKLHLTEKKKLVIYLYIYIYEFTCQKMLFPNMKIKYLLSPMTHVTMLKGWVLSLPWANSINTVSNKHWCHWQAANVLRLVASLQQKLASSVNELYERII